MVEEVALLRLSVQIRDAVPRSVVTDSPVVGSGHADTPVPGKIPSGVPAAISLDAALQPSRSNQLPGAEQELLLERLDRLSTTSES